MTKQLQLDKFSVGNEVKVQGAKWTPPPPAPKPKPMLILAIEAEEQLIQLYQQVYGSREEAKKKIRSRIFASPSRVKPEFSKQEILIAVFRYEMNKQLSRQQCATQQK